MSVKPITLGDGTVRWRVVVDVSPDLRKRKQKTLTFDDETTAIAEEKRLKNECKRLRADHQRLYGSPSGDSGVTVNEILDDYLDAVKVSERTKATYRGMLNHIRRHIGYRAAHTITSDDIAHVFEYMTKCGRRRGGTPGTALSERSAMLAINRLRAAYELAIFRGKITRRVIPIAPNPGVVVLRSPGQIAG